MIDSSVRFHRGLSLSRWGATSGPPLVALLRRRKRFIRGKARSWKFHSALSWWVDTNLLLSSSLRYFRFHFSLPPDARQFSQRDPKIEREKRCARTGYIFAEPVTFGLVWSTTRFLQTRHEWEWMRWTCGHHSPRTYLMVNSSYRLNLLNIFFFSILVLLVRNTLWPPSAATDDTRARWIIQKARKPRK